MPYPSLEAKSSREKSREKSRDKTSLDEEFLRRVTDFHDRKPSPKIT